MSFLSFPHFCNTATMRENRSFLGERFPKRVLGRLAALGLMVDEIATFLPDTGSSRCCTLVQAQLTRNGRDGRGVVLLGAEQIHSSDRLPDRSRNGGFHASGNQRFQQRPHCLVIV